MFNLDIRNAATNAGVKLWEIAEIYGISDTNFSKKLRRELPEPEKQKIFAIIEQIHSEKAAVSG